MKLLCVTTTDKGTTSWARYRGLLTTDLNVECFPVDEYLGEMSLLQRRLESRLFYGPGFARANRALVRVVQAQHPDVVWIDKGFWVWPSTLKKIRQQGAILVHHNTDALSPDNRTARWLYRLMRSTLSLYDVYLTSNLHDYHRLSTSLRPKTFLTHLGYDDERFDDTPLASDVDAKWTSDLVFVGHYEPRTEDYVCALVEANLSVAVYGANWDRAAKLAALRPELVIRPLSFDDYPVALKAAKIALGFVSKWNGNTTAGRSFEIPASGTFLLAMRTQEHQDLYQEGVEAEFFETVDELVSKARYYLDHDDERRAVAARGHSRCVNSDYSWRRYTVDDWNKIAEYLGLERQLQGRDSG